MGLPEITHLQYLILHLLGDEFVSAKELRRRIEESEKVLVRGPRFYQLMGRLVEDGFVESAHEDVSIGTFLSKETKYRVTKEGVAARNAVISFYAPKLA